MPYTTATGYSRSNAWVANGTKMPMRDCRCGTAERYGVGCGAPAGIPRGVITGRFSLPEYGFGGNASGLRNYRLRITDFYRWLPGTPVFYYIPDEIYNNCYHGRGESALTT